MKKYKDLVGSYENFANYLKNLCQKNKNISLETIEVINGFDLFKITINKRIRNSICISAGVHGNELAGPLAILEFLEHPIITDKRLVIFPLMNPTGWNNNDRFNYKNKDLNRTFHGRSVLNKETRSIINALEGEKVKFLLSLHEDDGGGAGYHPQNGFYIYYSHNQFRDLAAESVQLSKLFLPTNTQKQIRGDKADNGLVYVPEPSGDNTFEDYLLNRGIPYFCTETPGTRSLSKRIDCTRAIIDLVLLYYVSIGGFYV